MRKSRDFTSVFNQIRMKSCTPYQIFSDFCVRIRFSNWIFVTYCMLHTLDMYNSENVKLDTCQFDWMAPERISSLLTLLCVVQLLRYALVTVASELIQSPHQSNRFYLTAAGIKGVFRQHQICYHKKNNAQVNLTSTGMWISHTLLLDCIITSKYMQWFSGFCDTCAILIIFILILVVSVWVITNCRWDKVRK